MLFMNFGQSYWGREHWEFQVLGAKTDSLFHIFGKQHFDCFRATPFALPPAPSAASAPAASTFLITTRFLMTRYTSNSCNCYRPATL